MTPDLHTIRGLPIVISGPSGCGKTTLSRLLLDSNAMRESISYTTRPPRRGEEDGVHYHFVDEERFNEIGREGGFLESSDVHGYHYGTSAQRTMADLEAGHDVLFILDIVGGLKLKLDRTIDAVTIFLVPPSIRSLEERLVRRGTDGSEIISRRMASAMGEIRQGISRYDYIIVNNQIETALSDIRSVIRTEHLLRADRNDILAQLTEAQ